MQTSYKSWDFFIRFFHWSLVASILFCWWSARQEGWLEWHMYSGYFTVGLLIARIIWGFVGPRPARFSHFLYGPKHTLEYVKALLKGKEPHYISHNPLGGLATIALLLVIALQAGSGLFANDDIYLEGALAQYVSSATSTEFTEFHKAWFDALLGLVGLHILAVFFHQIFRKESLLQGMIVGKKTMTSPADDLKK